MNIWLVPAGFLGIAAGFALSLIAPEELKPGKKYFRALYAILFGSLAYITIAEFSNMAWGVAGFIAASIATYFVLHWSMFYLTALAFFANSVYAALVIYLIGMARVSLDASDIEKHSKIDWKNLAKSSAARYLPYLAVTISLFLAL